MNDRKRRRRGDRPSDRFPSRPSSAPQRKRRYGALWVAASLLVVTAAVAFYVYDPDGAAPVSPLPAGTNLLLISIDTLRADRLSVYRSDGVATPAIDRLAREGIVFQQAFTPVPLTLPAHASMLTGLLPFSHGIRDNGSGSLGPDYRTLAEAFAATGYRTAAFVSAYVLDSRWGLDRGFDEYVDGFDVGVMDLAAIVRVQRPASATWAPARRWLASHTGEPFFLWLHFFDPHTPYEPPEPFQSAYRQRPYEGEIAYVDSVLAEIMRELEARSLLDKTAIMLVSDHGEGLGDHGEDEHGLLTYDSTLKIPWIVRLPDRLYAGSVVEHPVSLVDLFPTVVELFGLPPSSTIDGVSHANALSAPDAGSGHAVYAESFYPRLRFGWSELQSVRTDRFKYIRAPRRELFDYRLDPGEVTNLIERHPDVAESLDRLLSSMLDQRAGAELKPTPLDPESARRLRALGYVAGRMESEPEGATKSLPDPRDKIHAYRTLASARELLETGPAARGIELLEGLLAEEPGFQAAHRMLREYLIAHGDVDRAMEKYRSELVRRPDDVYWLMDLGLIYQASERREEALEVFEQVLDQEPRHEGALTAVADIYESRGVLDEAASYFGRALEASPTSGDLKIRLAQVYLRQGHLGDSVALVNRAIAEHPGLSGGHYLLAQIAERAGDAGAAEREYRLEIDVSPWDYRARFNLAGLLGRRGAVAEQVALLESIPEIAPGFHDVHFHHAKALLDSGDPARLDDALEAASRGLSLSPESPSAPLGYYVRADVFTIQGRHAEAERERKRGLALEQWLAGR